MKKLLFFIFMIFFSKSYAQQLFTQNFPETSVLADFVLDAKTATTQNKFSALVAHPDVSLSVNGGKLRFSRPEGIAGGADANAASWIIGGPVNGGNANFDPIPTVTEFSMKFNLIESKAVGQRMFLVAGTGFTNDPRSPSNPNIHSGLMIETTADKKINIIRGTFDNPVGAGNSKPAVGPYSGEVTLKWVINNSGGSYTYNDPNNVSAEVANDTWDLYINNTLVLDNEPTTLLQPGGNSAKDKNITTFKFSFKQNEAGALVVDMDDISVKALSTTLPVSLTSFDIKKSNDNLKLTWNTASEQENSHFEILRSTDGKEFSSIGTVKGHGTSNQAQNYSFTDFSPAKGINYYQLKQIDFNGKENIHPEIVSGELEITKNNVFELLSIQNNTLNFSINSENRTSGELRIFDALGKTLYNKKTSLLKGKNTISISSISIPKDILIGNLLLDGKSYSIKFKQ